MRYNINTKRKTTYCCCCCCFRDGELLLSVDEPGSIAAPSSVADSRNKVATCIYQRPLQSDAAGAGAPTVCWYCTAVAVVVAAVFIALRRRRPGAVVRSAPASSAARPASRLSVHRRVTNVGDVASSRQRRPRYGGASTTVAAFFARRTET